MNHLGKAVPESARTIYQAEQVPFFDTATEDFAVAMLAVVRVCLKRAGKV